MILYVSTFVWMLFSVVISVILFKPILYSFLSSLILAYLACILLTVGLVQNVDELPEKDTIWILN